MKPARTSRIAQASLLLIPALCALLMSGAFFLHESRHNAARASNMLPGLTLAEARPASSGVIVTSVQTDGLAARQAVDVGDRIVAIDGDPIRSLDQASRHLLDNGHDTVILALVHDGRTRNIALNWPEQVR